MELDYKAIGKRIKIQRIQREMTQEKLAELTGLSNPHISNVETGSTQVSLKSLIAIANALEITPDVLLCDNIRYGSTFLKMRLWRLWMTATRWRFGLWLIWSRR